MNESLAREVGELAADAGAVAVGVAWSDLESGERGGLEPDRWFHAASTIKLAVLVALFGRMERDGLSATSRLHVRNQFTSLADGRYYRVERGSDGAPAVHRHIGRTMRILDLARHMIVTSSNLATNVLVELLTPETIQATVRDLGIDGIEFRRGVQDERAWAEGVNNRATPRGLAELLERIALGEAVSGEADRAMLEVLADQEFVSGIPAGAPEEARVANKTGEISTVTHDAAVVFLPDRAPYVLVVMTEWEGEGDAGKRRQLLAAVSRLLIPRVPEGASG